MPYSPLLLVFIRSLFMENVYSLKPEVDVYRFCQLTSVGSCDSRTKQNEIDTIARTYLYATSMPLESENMLILPLKGIIKKVAQILQKTSAPFSQT